MTGRRRRRARAPATRRCRPPEAGRRQLQEGPLQERGAAVDGDVQPQGRRLRRRDRRRRRCPCVDGAVRSCSNSIGECRKARRPAPAARGARAWAARSPAPETCDGKDNDCSGLTDEGVANACGTCGASPMELCGDGIDNDCNGLVDEQAAAAAATARRSRSCYRGFANTRGVGACHDGMEYRTTREISTSRAPAPATCCCSPRCATTASSNDCDGVTRMAARARTAAPSPGVNAGECTMGTQTCTNGTWSTCTGKGRQAETCDGKDKTATASPTRAC